MEICAPAASDAIEHGNGVEHAPLLLENTRPADGLSLMMRFVAFAGPRFLTTMLKVIAPPPGGMKDGPVLMICRSAPAAAIAVVTVAVLFVVFVSVGLAMLTVLTIDPGAAVTL